jgi:hypothetical protein
MIRRTVRCINRGFGGARKSIHEKAKQFEPISGVSYEHAFAEHQQRALPIVEEDDRRLRSNTIDFILPNMRDGRDCSGKLWFSSLTTVTPVRRDLSRIDFVAAYAATGDHIPRVCENVFEAGSGDDDQAGGGT